MKWVSAGITLVVLNVISHAVLADHRLPIDSEHCRGSCGDQVIETHRQTATARNNRYWPSEHEHEHEHEIQVTLAPASVKVFAFAELGIANGATLVEVPEGGLGTGVLEAAVSRQRLVIAAPGDSGTNQSYAVRLTSDTGDVVINIDVIPERALDVVTFNDADEEGHAPPPAPPLLISGLGNDNIPGGAPLVFALDDAPVLSALESRFLVSTSNGQLFDATPLFTLDKTTNSFIASQTTINAFVSSLPFGLLEFSVSLVSEDFSFTHNASFRFLRPSVTVNGQLVDAHGIPISGTTLNTLNIAVIGADSGIRRVVSVDTDGHFIAPNLIAETYHFTVIDLAQPNTYTAVLGIPQGTTNAPVTIYYEAVKTDRISSG